MKLFFAFFRLRLIGIISNIFFVLVFIISAILIYVSIVYSLYFLFAAFWPLYFAFFLIYNELFKKTFSDFENFEKNLHKLPNGAYQTEKNGDSFYFNILNGKRHGSFIKKSNGIKITDTSYKNDQLDGTYKSWWHDGNPKIETNYKNGQLDGTYKSWWHNGNRSIETNYKNGQLDGFQLNFSMEGKLFEKSAYEYGIEVSRTEYYPTGSPRIINKKNHYIFYSPNNLKVCEVFMSIENFKPAIVNPTMNGKWINLGTWVNYKEDGESKDYELNFKNCKQGKAKKTSFTKYGEINSLISYKISELSFLKIHPHFSKSRLNGFYSWNVHIENSKGRSGWNSGKIQIDNVTGIHDILDITDDEK